MRHACCCSKDWQGDQHQEGPVVRPCCYDQLCGQASPGGQPERLVCERGTQFGYNDLIVDPRNIVRMRDAGCPVVADVTHALQQPAAKV